MKYTQMLAILAVLGFAVAGPTKQHFAVNDMEGGDLLSEEVVFKRLAVDDMEGGVLSESSVFRRLAVDDMEGGGLLESDAFLDALQLIVNRLGLLWVVPVLFVFSRHITSDSQFVRLHVPCSSLQGGINV